MPVQFAILSDLRLAVFCYYKPITVDDVVRVFHSYVQHADFDGGQNLLVRVGHGTLAGLDNAAMQALSYRLEAYYARRNAGTRTALYVHDDTEFGMSRMYQSISDGRRSFDISVERSLDAALDYVGVGPDQRARVEACLDKIGCAPDD